MADVINGDDLKTFDVGHNSKVDDTNNIAIATDHEIEGTLSREQLQHPNAEPMAQAATPTAQTVQAAHDAPVVPVTENSMQFCSFELVIEPNVDTEQDFGQLATSTQPKSPIN